MTFIYFLVHHVGIFLPYIKCILVCIWNDVQYHYGIHTNNHMSLVFLQETQWFFPSTRHTAHDSTRMCREILSALMHCIFVGYVQTYHHHQSQLKPCLLTTMQSVFTCYANIPPEMPILSVLMALLQWIRILQLQGEIWMVRLGEYIYNG